MTTKSATIHIVTRLLQKVINKCFSWSTTISSQKSTVQWTFFIDVRRLGSHTTKRWEYTVMATKWAIIHILARLFQKVINESFSWSTTYSSRNSTILLKFLTDVRRLASVTTRIIRVHCPSYQMNYQTHFNSSCSKKLLTNVYQEIRNFFQLNQQFFEKLS